MAVDSVTPTIFILHENGALVKYIECSEYMTEPSDIAIFGSEYYICDFKGHSIVVMHENGNFFFIFILIKKCDFRQRLRIDSKSQLNSE